MKKKGQLMFKALFVVIIAAFIVFFFIQVGKTYGNGEAYSKLAIAKDIALTINTLSSYPGDISVKYPADLKKYTIKTHPNKITVSDSNIGRIDPTRGEYKFVMSNIKVIESEVKAPEGLLITKTDNNIKISSLR
ncbi:hypothetical protein GOV14_04735 [Candidatus Pacearchaeota archaeon]|nr:hypothetical protein [Candidatus Pacearchaeota archaeon]